MQNKKDNTLFYIIIIFIFLGLVFFASSLFRSEFTSGLCIKNKNDGYIWQINQFSFGKYRVMGWENGAWGNAVEMEKSVLERKDSNGMKIYNIVVCPEYKPR
jgi:hypothetical protein